MLSYGYRRCSYYIILILLISAAMESGYEEDAVFDEGKTRFAKNAGMMVLFIQPIEKNEQFEELLAFVEQELGAVEKPTWKSAKRYRNRQYGVLSTLIVCVEEDVFSWEPGNYEGADPRFFVVPP